MEKDTQIKETGINRRGFLKATGISAAALMLANCGYTSNPGATSMADVSTNQSSTDVLVIGGGMAGAFAAVAAKNRGLNVTLVDKGTVGRSGSTPWANTFSVFDEEAGDDRDEWIAGVRGSSEYVNNLDWLDQMLDNSKDRWNDINAWGLTSSTARHPSLVLREKLQVSGVELIERTMITTLLTEGEDDSRVVGAMGFSIDTEEAVVILAKATIICAGAGSFKASGFPIQSLTSDGDAMAYRAGAIISGKEWEDFHWTNADTPASCWNQWSGMWDSGINKMSQVFTAGMTLSSAYLAHSGDAAISGDTSDSMSAPPDGDLSIDEGSMPDDGERPSEPPDGEEVDAERPSRDEGEGERSEGAPGQSSGVQVGGAATGLGIHKAEGIWPINLEGACNLPGLYAAGDGLASMLCGASYVGLGFSLSGSAVQGATAGEGAADYALQAADPNISDQQINDLTTAMFAPRERTTGFTPAWVTQVLQNTMFPYFVLMVKEEARLNAALSTITFLREHLVPYLTANDAHDLRLAHETTNMLLNAEMKLRASLYRTESRGTHYREDFPARDDDNWLAWVLLQQDENGDMTVTKKEVPDEWKPDQSIPYEERYPNRYPGELEYLGLA